MLFATLCVGLSMTAQTSGREVLVGVLDNLKALGCYRIDFQVTMPTAEAPSEGYCIVDDLRFVISIDGMKQGYDGEKVWWVDAIAREIVYDNHKPQSYNLFDNPTKAFDFSDELFRIADFDDSGEESWMITLSPAQGVLDGIEYAILWVDKKTGLPVRLGYDLSGIGIYINVLKVASAESSEVDFGIDPADYDDYEVIDFR